MAETQPALQQLCAHARQTIRAADSLHDLEQMRVRYLGRKGEITTRLKHIAALAPDQRKVCGRQINLARDRIQGWLEQRRQQLERESLAQRLLHEQIDVTQPGRSQSAGSRHPISHTLDHLIDIFERLGFALASGPEIEHDYYNFEALNIPADHPARAMHDTFYIDDSTVLRTHTSPVQIRHMHTHTPPIRVIAPGKVYRCDSDVTHTPMFHQLEGLAVDRDLTFADLKGLLIFFLREFFETDIEVRFRPSYFPFTEPSAEVDIACVLCHGRGCRTCRHSGWLEVLGAGMVHPEVFRHGEVDAKIYSGYAFGLGVERLAMLRYGVDDIRLYFANDLTFLRQFARL